MSEPLLRVEAIETFYGPIQAIRGVSLEVDPGQIVTVLGANGAGKTTRAADDLRRSGPRTRPGCVRGPRHRPHAARSGHAPGHLPCAGGARRCSRS